MENNLNNEKNTLGWKAGTKPLPTPIVLEDVNEEALIIKRKDKEE